MEGPVVVPRFVPVPVPGVLSVVAPMLVLLLSSQWLYAHEVPAMYPMLVVASSLPVPHPLYHLYPPVPALPVEVPLAL